jgi:hypothetical protein
MDEAILSEVKRILAVRRADHEAVPGASEYSREYARKSETDQIKTFKKYYQHVETLKLIVGKPSVRKVRGAGRWYFTKDRLFVHPMVTLQSSVLKTDVRSQDIFRRFSQWSPNSPLVPNAGFDFTDQLLDKNGQCVGTTTIQICEELVPLIHQIFGAKFDEWNSQLQTVHAEVQSRLTELVDAHKKRVGHREQKKFQEKLFRFLAITPSFSDAAPEFILTCLRIEPNDLENLQKFLRLNKADVNFISEDDIVEAQKLAKVHEIMKS